jgi:hypothetical protein
MKIRAGNEPAAPQQDGKDESQRSFFSEATD